jgi:hypothetical protein
VPGTGANVYGGTGGVGLSGSFDGNGGLVYGGGGAGSVTSSSTDRNGGTGANGQVIITWTVNCPTITVVATPTNLNCFNDGTGQIQISATGGSGNYNYSIDNGLHYNAAPHYAGNGLYSGLSVGTYQIRVKDNTTGCLSKSVQ